MELSQFKLLAGRIRGQLAKSNIAIGHSQALDLCGALAGVRNWPEVQAFPDRVSGLNLDLEATGRLAHRLNKRHGTAFSAGQLLDLLRPPSEAGVERLPQLWPTGPRPGVYVTMEQAHIEALLELYDDATDGALVYAERAVKRWASSIDLGEDGLWSSGLQKVPSGTLVVVGPLSLTQQAWIDVHARLEMACLHVRGAGLRVAVQVETNTPQTLHYDLDLMIRMRQPEDGDLHESLIGVVTAEGELAVRSPFATCPPAPVARPTKASLDPLPAQSIPLLREALEKRKTGLLLLGSNEHKEHWANSLVTAVLPLTDFAGPAARIKPRDRSTPSKDWDVPEALKALPFLPSIESAFAQGYRRMVIDPGFTHADLITEYGDRVLFIAGGYGSSVDELFTGSLRYGGLFESRRAIEGMIAILGVTALKSMEGEVLLADLFVPAGQVLPEGDSFSKVLKVLKRDRVLRVEEELARLLDDQRVSAAVVKELLPREQWAKSLMAKRSRAGRSGDKS